jgi:hypothetical protein
VCSSPAGGNYRDASQQTTPPTNLPTHDRTYTRASELKDFAFCQRAWFLERQGVQTELTDARELGTADHLERATAVRRGRTLDRVGRRLFLLGLIGLAVMILIRLLQR